MAGGYYSVYEVQTTGGALDAFDLYPNHSAIIFKPFYMIHTHTTLYISIDAIVTVPVSSLSATTELSTSNQPSTGEINGTTRKCHILPQ